MKTKSMKSWFNMKPLLNVFGWAVVSAIVTLHAGAVEPTIRPHLLGNLVIGNFLRGQERGAHAFEVSRDKKSLGSGMITR